MRYTYINSRSSEKGISFLELSRPLARPPGAGRLEVEGFGWAWDRILRRKCLGPARALAQGLQVGSKLTTNFQGRSAGDHWEAIPSMLFVFDFQRGRRSGLRFRRNRNMHCSIERAAANNYRKCSKSGSARHWFW